MSFMEDEIEDAVGLVAGTAILGLVVSLFCGCGTVIIPSMVFYQVGRTGRRWHELQRPLVVLFVLAIGYLGFAVAISSINGVNSGDASFGDLLIAYAVVFFVFGGVYYGAFFVGKYQREQERERIRSRKLF